MDAIKNLPVPIIRTKLYPPPMAPDTIQRQRLLSLAQSAEQSPITLVSAPAGYGKSTLVSQWLDLLRCKSTWLSLDNEDSELTQFLSYVVAALHDTYPGCCVEFAEILQSSVLPDVHSLAGIFCNEIDAYKETMVLILDDYHLLSSKEVDDFLDTVLKHPPQNMHLVIVSRRDPSLSLHALRARGALCEVRLQQLRFREDETRALMSLGLGDTITDDEIRVLHERTEGWPVALRLARLATAKTSSTSSVVEPLDFISRLVSLVPKPRVNLTRFHGVFA